ncbi:unnamed protein product [Triticum aestivum]|uniref:DUF1618 domain-containing protein n=4 Tax=Triticinae TaxID=1648030 RepID=A0A9R1JEF9_WHEAT|nr:uncharacterized protein LOC123051516 [Triticum aestivum]KAF7013974.1 hypothetical protein CFC21_028012 [Triticum aestivum]SPT16278.1 unnamed protein product [Triticum aestivum]
MSDDGFLESLFGKFYHDESLRPPPESGDGEAEDDSWDWHEALVDNAAYMIYERNHTTAQCPVSRKVRGGGVKQDFLQVTFCLSQPPHISYFCMSYTSRDPSQFRCEPTIFATEGNLAVIGLIHNWTLQNSPSCVYFVYRAPILGSQFPQLTLLPHPPSEVFPEQYESECQLGHNEIGILRYRSNSASKHLPFTPPTPTLSHNPAPALSRRRKSHTTGDDYDAYKIATLCYYGTNQYVLYIYDSVADAWSRTPTAFPRPQDAPPEHLCNRVITVGGAMGWVDLWHGILLCDVHVPSPAEEEESPGPRLLHYVPLPEPMQPDNDLRLHGFSSFFRDIAVVNGRIKFVDLQLHASPGSRTPNGWTAVTWSMAPGDSGFSKDGELNSCDLVNPMEPSLFVAHPTLSSHHDGVLYLMTKASMDDSVSQVIAVNMKNKEIERTAKYTTHREACMDFAYTRAIISNFLAPDSKGTTKRPGSVLQGSFRKKLPVINPSTHLPTMGDEGDAMDLE